MPPMNRAKRLSWLLVVAVTASGCVTTGPHAERRFHGYRLNYATPVDAGWQAKLEAIDASLREPLEMTTEHAAVGLLDLHSLRLAMLQPDREAYAASVPKIGILLAYFQLHPTAATNLDATTRQELALMTKISSNEMAAKYSRELGLKPIQAVLNEYGLYDANRGGGLWVGKHYGRDAERYGSPVGDNSHAATVRQLLRYYLMLEQGKLVSPTASRTMREIFATPEIPADQNYFVQALAERDVQIIRKWGRWQDWHHDTAVITGEGRHYILVALTKHPRGADYLVGLAQAVDEWMLEVNE
jgi:beta-lactamase class A